MQDQEKGEDGCLLLSLAVLVDQVDFSLPLKNNNKKDHKYEFFTLTSLFKSKNSENITYKSNVHFLYEIISNE